MMNIILMVMKTLIGGINMIKIYYKNLANGAITASLTVAMSWYTTGANVAVKKYNYLKKSFYTNTVWVH